MRPDTQGFGDALAAATTILRRVLGRDREHFPTGACCLEGKDGQALRPTRIRYGLGEVVILDHIADRQRFVRDDIVDVEKLIGFLVVEVQALAAYRLMTLRQFLHRFLAAVTAFLPATDPALMPFELPFHLAQPARIRHLIPL
jgi:hypothetical protein